jgi:glutaredoxin-related protein
MSITPLTPYLMAVFHPRKPKHRTAFVALLVIICLSAYIFVVHASYLSPPMALRHSDSPAADLALETIQNSRVALTPGTAESSNKYKLGKSHRLNNAPPLRLSPSQELAAITSFLASLPRNVIPPAVDPTQPIDPQLVLDFDTRGYRAPEEVRAMVEDVWTRNPVFLYSKVYSPASRELKGILDNLNLKPAPTIMDVDVRDDSAVLLPILKRLLPFPELPILLIGGQAVGSIEQVRELEKDGELQKLITASGSIIDGAKRKKHKK